MFLGKYTLLLDDNHEITLPLSIHPAMSGSLYLTQGFERYLLLLPQEAFHNFLSYLRSISIADPLSRLLRRMFLGSVVEFSVGEEGKISLPANLCQYANLDREVILVGQGDYLEIWSAPQWQEQMETLLDPQVNSNRFEKFYLATM